MDFRDKVFQTSALIVLGALTGIIFPKLVQWILWVAFAVGLGGLGCWVLKTVRKR